jgi:inner membrane protease ATP23
MLAHVDSLPAPEYTAPADMDASKQANSPVPIFCSPCGPDRGGGFAPGVGVVLCQDRLFGKNHVEDTLAHELVHEWDHRRFKVDWQDLRHLACSEVSNDLY